MSIRVLLADDHTILREGLRSLLGALEGIEVVADVADGEEAIAAAGEFAPDVALLDIAMGKMDGLKATALIKSVYPGIRVVILSMYQNHEYLDQAFAAGASGYVVKDAAAEQLEEAIRTVAAGGTFVRPSGGQGATPGGAFGPPGSAELDRLTHRQLQVLRLIAAGRTTKGIARDLGISTKTVETHRSQLMDRLDIFDVPGLVKLAVRSGLVDAYV